MSSSPRVDDPDLRALADERMGNGSLDPKLRALAALISLRRTIDEFDACCEVARTAGAPAAWIEAIGDEDWTDPSFDDAARAVFEYAMLFDAGLGISEAVFAKLCKQLPEVEINELSLLCASWGAVARISIARSRYEETSE